MDFVLGDIRNAEICPGPFDVIIERRTAQLFSHLFKASLAGRLAKDGIFFSHSHDGRWRPPAEPRHFTEPWFKENGWKIWHPVWARKPQGQVAWLFTSTG